MKTPTEELAIDGGTPAVQDNLPPMYPGGWRVGEEEEREVLEVIRSKRLFRFYGPGDSPSKVARFEVEFCETAGVERALAVSSCTGALLCSMAAVGVGPGDEVIVPAFTWIATATAVVAAGGVPVICEVDRTLTMDLADVEAKITERTKAIVAVHMRGMTARMAELRALCDARGIALIEDAAQAMGGSYRGKAVGTWGDCTAFSLQYNKLITCGEGGVFATTDERLYHRGVMAHDVIGFKREDVPENEVIHGLNFRMSELQGAVALAQLRKLGGIRADLARNQRAILEAARQATLEAGWIEREKTAEDADSAICAVWIAPSVDAARWAAEALDAEGVPTINLLPEERDYHVHRDWSPVLNKLGWSDSGFPYRDQPATADYSRKMCPISQDLLQRTIHVDVSPDYTPAMCEQIATGITKVCSRSEARA